MVSTGNKAKLVSSKICQKCAKCCKEFGCSFDIDCALRFLWLENKKIKASGTPFIWADGKSQNQVVFDFPCSQLDFKDRQYSCKVWNKERPDFCNTYPDHIFYSCEIWDVIKIKKLLEFESDSCPALKEVSVEQVQKMLKEHRGEE